jgi:glyoxylase-like metal-dependent hydrolase (beta-lactamase superfamily II)/predicted ester cyclase
MSTVAADTAAVAERYFAALADRDVDAMVALWAPGGREHIRGQVDTTAPNGVREYFTALFAAVPDFRLEVVSATVEGRRACVRWSARGTFAGAPFKGIEPTGSAIALEGIDELTISGGQIQENNAFSDGLAFARQIGMLPDEGTRADVRLTRAFNARTRAVHRLTSAGPDPVAEGVWVVRGGFPQKGMNVYLVRDGDGVLAFDAGIRQMAGPIAVAAASLGGLTRVVLGHAHPDHRGAAAGLGAPVWCHEAERADAEGDGGMHTFDLRKLDPVGRRLYGRLLPYWDGGPVPVAGTLREGDDVAGFEVVHLPGHAPGLIALWRAADRLALTSDCFYTVDPQTLRRTHPPTPRLPHAAFTEHVEQARTSLRRLAALEPAAAWPGHAEPLTGDVRAQLERAAAA